MIPAPMHKDFLEALWALANRRPSVMKIDWDWIVRFERLRLRGVR